MENRDPVACVMGWPVAHSRSPLIHRYWLKTLGIAGDYRREAVPPDEFPAFLASLSERGYVGGNVTIPLKEIAFAHSLPDETGRGIGAVNTVWLEGDRLLSTNTDAEGFLANLDEGAPGWDAGERRACLIGAGGSARAVVYALLSRGFEVEVVNRSLANAEAMARQFGEKVRPHGWDALDRVARSASLLVNSSPLGMVGQPPLPFEPSILRREAVVSDLIYVPLKTKLISASEALGLRAVGGLGMLLHQARRGFELWFGVKPEVTGELRSLVEAEIVGAAAAATSRP